MEPPNSLRMDSFKRIQGAFLVIGPKNYPIFKGVNTVGRNKIAIVNIKHLNVSQNQAIIVLVDENQHYVSDLNSSNGTFLHNSKLIPYKLYELMNGVEIKFGDVSAVYSKVPRNTRLNLHQTLDTTEMTQDMTQNFYASNTQLLFNKRDISDHRGDHSYFNAETSNSSSSNIHEEATQIVDNPLHLPNTEIMDNTQSQFESCVVVEERVDDIHDAATQVVCMTDRIQPDNSSTNQNIQKEPCQIFENSCYNKDIHVAPTQVVGCSETKDKEKMSSHSASSTQTVNTQDLIEAINVTINSTDSNTQELTTQEKQDLIDKIDKQNEDVNKVDMVEIESSEDIIKCSSVETLGLKKNLILTTFQKKNVIHNSQTPSTSKAVPNSEYDESFLNESETGKGVIEETILENPNSNDSIDFLDIQNTQDGVLSKPFQNIHINSGIDKLVTSENQSTTDSEMKEISFRKRTAKLMNSQESDSETDIDDTETIGFRKKTVKQLSTQESNSETDIDDTETIGSKKKPVKQLSIEESVSSVDDTEKVRFRKKPVRQLLSQDSDTDIESQQIGSKKRNVKPLAEDSDSNTDIDDNVQTKKLDEPPKISNSDSETDCEDEIFQKINDDMVTKDDSASNKNEMNDSDCIPATQDAFAEALGYEPTRSQHTNQESEESFKLGLTELMDYSQTVTEDNNGKNGIEDMPKIDENFNKKDANIVETDGDKIYLMPTQKIGENSSCSKKFTFKKKSCTLDESLTTILNNNTNREVKDDVVEAGNSFFKPTQNICDENSEHTKVDDVFLQPTQKIVTETSELPEDDDLFLQPTQKLDSDTSQRTDNDVFLQPGKPIKKRAIKNNSQLEKIDEDSDDIFLQPTQKLMLEEPVVVAGKDVFIKPNKPLNLKKGSSKITNTQDDDVYMVATQLIEQDADEKTKDIPMTQEDLYGQATQKLDVTSQEPDSVIQNQDVYDVETQKVDDVSIVQAEKISTELNTDSNLLDTQLEMPFNSQTTHFKITEDSNRPSNPIIRELDHLSNQDEEPGSSNRDNLTNTCSFKEPLTIKDNTKPKADDTETLSQIEAFIKKPLPPTSTRRSVRKSNLDKKDAPETLSQIEAFVNKSGANEFQSKKLSKNEVPPETLSKNGPFFSKPLPKIQELNMKEDEIDIVSRRLSKRISSNSITISDNKVIHNLTAIREDEEQGQLSSKSSDETLNDSERSRELKSDIDQSFALLESKSSKVRRKPKNDSAVNEIKVVVTSHRKSMGVAELLTPKIVIPVKKTSNKTNISDDSSIEEPAKAPRGRRSRKPSISNEPEKRVSVRGKKIEETKDSDTADSNSKASIKPPATRKSRKASSSSEPEPAPRKSRKLSTSNEPEKISARGKKAEEALETITEDAPTKRNVKKQPHSSKEVEDSSKTDKRISKRRMSDSSESDFAPSGPSTPAKRGRIGAAKVNNVPSTDSSDKSRDSSASSHNMTTPRKGKVSIKTESLLASAERSKRKQKPKVVFTMLDSPQLESFIKHLGGSIVDTVDTCTVLVTQSIKRSQKLLTAVAQGKPICSPEWIRSSKQNNDFLDPWDYLLVDEAAEKKWDFSLRESLIKAVDNKLLNGYIFQLMVTNALDVLKGAIEASGGKIVTKQPGKSELNNFIIIATVDQKSKFQKIKKQHPEVRVVEPEAIFDGVLRQELRLSRHLVS